VPVFKNRSVFEIARGIKAFLNVEAGITRGRVPEPDSKSNVPKVPGARGSAGRRSAPAPRSHANASESYLLVTYDSCRFDAYQEARTPVLDTHATARQAWAQANYTYASHAAMFQGHLPHVFAEEPYYNRYVNQLWRIENPRSAKAHVLLPPDSSSIIDGFNQLNYFTCGTGAMHWFRSKKNHLRWDWQAWKWTGTDARQQVDWIKDELSSRPDQPFFAFINFGETHFPYEFDGQSGVENRSEARSLRRRGFAAEGEEHAFDEDMWRLQVASTEFLDERIGDLLDFYGETGRRVKVVMCSDHGECFGEEGFYGHGFYHPKVLEVPMAIFDVEPAAR
jgi:hypothetical protein